MPDLWPCGDHMRAHCTPDEYDKLIRWDGVEKASTYSRGVLGPVIAYDVMFDESLAKKVRRFLSRTSKVGTKPRRSTNELRESDRSGATIGKNE